MGIAALLPQRAATPTGESNPPPAGASYSAAILWRLLTVIGQCATGERTLSYPAPPCNPVTGHAFRGFNRLALTAHQLAAGTSDPRYVTFEQVADLGAAIGAPLAHVKQGSRQLLLLRPRGTAATDPNIEDAVTLDAILDAATSDRAPDPAGARLSLDVGSAGSRFDGPRRLRPYGVFHASQIAGLAPLPSLATPPRSPRAALVSFLSDIGIDPDGLPVSRDAATSREAHLAALLDAGFRAHAKQGGAESLDRDAIALGAAFAALLGSLALGVRRPLISAAGLPDLEGAMRLPPPAQLGLLRGANEAYSFCDELLAHTQQASPSAAPVAAPTL